MKYIFAVALLCGVFMFSHGQQSEPFSDKRNEINLGSFNAFELSESPNLGIGYKRTVKKGAWRFGTGFRYSNNSRDLETSPDIFTSWAISPRAGYEFHQNYNRLQLHYGVELASSFSSAQSERNDVGDPNYDFYQSKGVGIILRPVLGLKVFLAKSVSITTETYLYVSYSKSTTTNTYGTTTNTYSNNGTSVGLGPLGIFSVNIHF